MYKMVQKEDEKLVSMYRVVPKNLTSSMIPHVKMPKAQLVVELMNCTLGSNPRRVPPKANYNIVDISFF